MSTNVHETEEDVKDALVQVVGMGFDENEAKEALALASNNPELAVQYLLGEVDFEEHVSDASLRRRTRHRYKELRSCLMDNPAFADYAVAAIMKKPRAVAALQETVGTQGVHFLESLLESSSDDER